MRPGAHGQDSMTHTERTDLMLKELQRFAAIFSSDERENVDLSCTRYYLWQLGKDIKKQGGQTLLDQIYAQVKDPTGEIGFEWSKL